MAVAHEASSALRLAPAASAVVERLFEEHSARIYASCLRRLRSPEEAEDALQATYLNACRSLNQGFEPRADAAWLFKVAENVCISRLRSSGRRARLERVQDMEMLEETVPAPEREADDLIGLPEALATLPAQQRHAILLREWQGLSYREVGGRLGLTQSAVETLIFRARRSLAAALNDPERRRRKALVRSLDGAGLLAGLKSLFLGATAAKVVVAAAVAATATVVATGEIADRGRPDAPPATKASASAAPVVSSATDQSQVAAAERVLHVRAAAAEAGHEPRGRAVGHEHGKPSEQAGKAQGNAYGKGGNEKAQAHGHDGSGREFGQAQKASHEPPAHSSAAEKSGKKP